MNSGHFHPLVSRRVTAIVEMHCGANTNHIRKASAVGSDQRRLSASGDRRLPGRAVLIGAHRITVPSAATAISRAAIAGISASVMSRSKPIGLVTTATLLAIRPATE